MMVNATDRLLRYVLYQTYRYVHVYDISPHLKSTVLNKSSFVKNKKKLSKQSVKKHSKEIAHQHCRVFALTYSKAFSPMIYS